ncbi:MAG: hypothetical protein ACRCYQ_00510 [Nocardioides sp.]
MTSGWTAERSSAGGSGECPAASFSDVSDLERLKAEAYERRRVRAALTGGGGMPAPGAIRPLVLGGLLTGVLAVARAAWTALS